MMSKQKLEVKFEQKISNLRNELRRLNVETDQKIADLYVQFRKLNKSTTNRLKFNIVFFLLKFFF